jgi:DNA-binding NarL/FixJ family response regulator
MGIKVLLADGHKMICEALSMLLEKEPDLEVVAVAYDFETALRSAGESNPDVMVISMKILETYGFEEGRQIIGQFPRCRVIAMAENTDRRHVAEAFKAGVRGYILKVSSIGDLVGAIRSVAENNGFLDPKINDALLYEHGENPRKSRADEVRKLLSEREKEVLRLMSEGKNNHEIAAALDIKAKTIESHRRHISRKLGMSNIAELTRYAIRQGISSL